MSTLILTLLLILQIFFSYGPAVSELPAMQDRPHAQPVWWGMIDPELSTLIASLPHDGDAANASIRWSWSWSDFLAALLPQPLVKEAADVPSL